MIRITTCRALTAAAVLALGARVSAGQTPAAGPAPAPHAVATPATAEPTLPPAARQGLPALYTQARSLIDDGRFDDAVARLNEMAARLGKVGDEAALRDRLDAAMYWKAYALSRLGERLEALSTLTDMERRFGASGWLKDARALELEIRQASGQTISPDAQPDDELKLLALRGLVQTDPDRAVPIIGQILSGNGSVRVKENALFVLSQSRSPQARQTLAGIAKSASNPDLQLRALRYLGLMGGPDNLQVLDEVYRTSSNEEVKRAILRSFMVAHDRARLVAAAGSDASPDLRDTAIQQLGVMRANTELSSLYRSETDAGVKKIILQALFVGGASDRLVDLARTETNEDLKASAVRDLGLMNASQTGNALESIYAGRSSSVIKDAVIEAFFVQRNATALVALARAEKDPDLKKKIVSRLSMMRSPEATDYLLELLK